MEINFLPFKYYHIYQARTDGWYLLWWEHRPPGYTWQFHLTPKKIVYELFKINGGNLGFYLVNIRDKKFHYCGTQLDDVKAKLDDEGGLIKKVFVSSSRARIPRVIEEHIDLSSSNCLLIYRLVNGKFIPYDSSQFIYASPQDGHYPLEDLGINDRELYERFLLINGGKPGFYIYKAGVDEVLYLSTLQEVNQVKDC